MFYGVKSAEVYDTFGVIAKGSLNVWERQIPEDRFRFLLLMVKKNAGHTSTSVGMSSSSARWKGSTGI